MDRTNAERQRRYIARLKAAAAQAQDSVTNADAQARIRELKGELERMRGQLAQASAQAAGQITALQRKVASKS